jgi:hypothetical protein
MMIGLLGVACVRFSDLCASCRKVLAAHYQKVVHTHVAVAHKNLALPPS